MMAGRPWNWPNGKSPIFVILDLMLPVVDGWEVCRQLRKSSDVPILILSAREEEIDRVSGLTLGADDYVVKPFSPRELVARVKAILRRGRLSDNQRQKTLVSRRSCFRSGKAQGDVERTA